MPVSPVGGPLHLLGADHHLLRAVLAVAGVATFGLITVALAGLARRRSWTYFLVTLALTTLLARSLIGVLSFGAIIEPMPHHILEHALDVATVALLVGAIVLARVRDTKAGWRP